MADDTGALLVGRRAFLMGVARTGAAAVTSWIAVVLDIRPLLVERRAHPAAFCGLRGKKVL